MGWLHDAQQGPLCIMELHAPNPMRDGDIAVPSCIVIRTAEHLRSERVKDPAPTRTLQKRAMLGKDRQAPGFAFCPFLQEPPRGYLRPQVFCYLLQPARCCSTRWEQTCSRKEVHHECIETLCRCHCRHRGRHRALLLLRAASKGGDPLSSHYCSTRMGWRRAVLLGRLSSQVEYHCESVCAQPRQVEAHAHYSRRISSREASGLLLEEQQDLQAHLPYN